MKNPFIDTDGVSYEH